MSPGEYFSALLKEKKIHKKSNEIHLKIEGWVCDVTEDYLEAVEAWRKGDWEKAYSIRDKIIEMEREADQVKELVFENIFMKKKFLPGITEERYQLITHADKLLGIVERAVRTLCMKKLDDSYFPQELLEIFEKTDEVIQLFGKANKTFFDDFEEATRYCRKLENVRDEVRDLYFNVLGKILNDEYPRGTKRVLDATVRISIYAEDTIDYLKVVIAKHS